MKKKNNMYRDALAVLPWQTLDDVKELIAHGADINSSADWAPDFHRDRSPSFLGQVIYTMAQRVEAYKETHMTQKQIDVETRLDKYYDEWQQKYRREKRAKATIVTEEEYNSGKQAIIQPCTEMLKFAFDNGFDMSSPARQISILQNLAYTTEREDVLKILLDHGLDPNVGMGKGVYYYGADAEKSDGPFMEYVLDPRIALMMLKAGARPSVNLLEQRDHWAKVGTNPELVEALAAYETPKSKTLIEAVSKGDTDDVRRWVATCANPNKGSEFNDGYYTPLMEAMHYGYFEIAKLLIDAGGQYRRKPNTDTTTAGSWGEDEFRESVSRKKDPRATELIAHMEKALTNDTIFTKRLGKISRDAIAERIKDVRKKGLSERLDTEGHEDMKIAEKYHAYHYDDKTALKFGRKKAEHS